LGKIFSFLAARIEAQNGNFYEKNSTCHLKLMTALLRVSQKKKRGGGAREKGSKREDFFHEKLVN
jgi:hypothetical protein